MEVGGGSQVPGGGASQGGGSGSGGGGGGGGPPRDVGNLADDGIYHRGGDEEEEEISGQQQVDERMEQMRMWGEFLREKDIELREKQKREPPKQLKTIEQPAIIPVVPSEPSLRFGGKEKTGLDKSINIKVTTSNRNIINEKRKKKTKKGITKARKAYNSLKRQTIRAIRLGKKNAYRDQSKAINKLPVKKRKAARARLKTTLKTREFTLVSKLPPSTKMTLADLLRVTKIAEKLRW